MAARTDDMRDRIVAYAFPRGGVEVVRANRGYTLYSRRTDTAGAPTAPFHACGQPARVTRFRCCGGGEPLGPPRVTSARLSCRSIRPSSLSPPKASSGSMPEVYNLTKPAKSS